MKYHCNQRPSVVIYYHHHQLMFFYFFAGLLAHAQTFDRGVGSACYTKQLCSELKSSQNHLPQGGIDADDFIGVDRRRKRNKKFQFISGIHESVKESQILSYLEIGATKYNTYTHILVSKPTEGNTFCQNPYSILNGVASSN